MSRCDVIRPDLVALGRGELTAADEAAARSHVAACAACAAELRKLARTAELVCAATAIEPSPAASRRLRAAVDDALRAGRAPLHDLAAHRASRGFLRDAWDHARTRYEQSATVRRFTLASIGVHAAAAAVLVALLARGDAIRRPSATITWSPDTPVALDRLAEPPSALTAYEPMSAEGVESARAPGVRFPTRAAAERRALSMTVAGRAGAFRVVLDADADRAAGALDRGLAWLAAQRGDDGAARGATDVVEATALSVLAFASAGRSSVDDPGLAASTAWLERSADAADTADRALAARALVAQFVTDFGRVPAETRRERARSVATAVAGLAARQRPDGAFGDTGTTLLATAALVDARVAGVADTAPALAAAARWIEFRRSPDGRLAGSHADDAVALTAALAALAPDAGIRPVSEHVADALESRVASLAARPRAAALGADALAALGRPVGPALRRALDAQQPDGRWAGPRGDPARAVPETAWGVVTLTAAFR